jgi:hypothetical protein
LRKTREIPLAQTRVLIQTRGIGGAALFPVFPDLPVFPEREGDAGEVRLQLDSQYPGVLLIAPAAEDG